MSSDVFEKSNLEELDLLRRTLNASVFQFVIVQYNHPLLVDETKNFILQQFPDRPGLRVRLDSEQVCDFIPQILEFESGIIFLENAEQLLENPHKNISIGLNQRRDNYSLKPIQIIAFLPDDLQVLRDFKTLMPDLYSIVNLNIKLKKQFEPRESNPLIFGDRESMYNNLKEAQEDIIRISERLNSLDTNQENLALIIQLKYNLASAYKFLGEYDKALKILDSVSNPTNPNA